MGFEWDPLKGQINCPKTASLFQRPSTPLHILLRVLALDIQEIAQERNKILLFGQDRRTDIQGPIYVQVT